MGGLFETVPRQVLGTATMVTTTIAEAPYFQTTGVPAMRTKCKIHGRKKGRNEREDELRTTTETQQKHGRNRTTVATETRTTTDDDGDAINPSTIITTVATVAMAGLVQPV